MNIAIIGGGASALMCACFVNSDVTIFCREEKVGKKILLTGNGRCNLSNTKYFKDSYNVDIAKYLQKFDYKQTIDFFESIGLLSYCDDMGRVYPISNTATSVVEVLTNYIGKKCVTLKTSYTVSSIKKVNNKFLIDDKFLFDKVVIATGSENNLLDNLGVSYNKFYPSLVALKTKQNTKRLSGLKLSNVKVTLKDKQEYGEVLFKDSGISGICIFNLSSFLARQKNYNEKISIDLLPNFSNNTLEKMFEKRINNYQNMYEFMQGIFHKEINKYLLKISNINEQEKPNKNNINKIIKNIKSLEFDIVGIYENNQVKSGGVDIADLDENLQHKDIQGLYFTGEVCDVDGLCGGYNLQWAWTSGKIVGDNL